MPCYYVIKCEDGCYYVGKTDRLVQQRYAQHVAGKGSEWTKLHKPIKLLKYQNNSNIWLEDQWTKECVAKYGIDKVRGGSYSNTILSKEQVNVLSNEINTAKNLCFNCNKSGHFAKDCKVNAKKKIPISKNPKRCSRCGRNSHKADKCYAKTDTYGNDLDSEDEEGCIIS